MFATKKIMRFLKELESLFDITNQNVMEMMAVNEDKQFLLALRAERQVCMLSVDQKLTRTEKRIAEWKKQEKKIQQYLLQRNQMKTVTQKLRIKLRM